MQETSGNVLDSGFVPPESVPHFGRSTDFPFHGSSLVDLHREIDLHFNKLVESERALYQEMEFLPEIELSLFGSTRITLRRKPTEHEIADARRRHELSLIRSAAAKKAAETKRKNIARRLEIARKRAESRRRNKEAKLQKNGEEANPS